MGDPVKGQLKTHRRGRTSPIARLVARGLSDRRALVRKLIIGEAIGDRRSGIALQPAAAAPAPAPAPEPGPHGDDHIDDHIDDRDGGGRP